MFTCLFKACINAGVLKLNLRSLQLLSAPLKHSSLQPQSHTNTLSRAIMFNHPATLATLAPCGRYLTLLVNTHTHTRTHRYKVTCTLTHTCKNRLQVHRCMLHTHSQHVLLPLSFFLLHPHTDTLTHTYTFTQRWKVTKCIYSSTVFPHSFEALVISLNYISG